MADNVESVGALVIRSSNDLLLDRQKVTAIYSQDGLGSTCFPIIQNFLVFVFPCACSTQEKSEKRSQWNSAQVSLHTRNNAITTKGTKLGSSLAFVV